MSSAFLRALSSTGIGSLFLPSKVCLEIVSCLRFCNVLSSYYSSLIVILYIFDCVPEMTGENIGKEYLRQADRKSIADKGNLKVAPAKSESGCGEILFG